MWVLVIEIKLLTCHYLVLFILAWSLETYHKRLLKNELLFQDKSGFMIRTGPHPNYKIFMIAARWGAEIFYIDLAHDFIYEFCSLNSIYGFYSLK